MPESKDADQPVDSFGGIKQVTVYNPATGEAVEVTNLNAHDLVTHLRWTRSKPVVILVEADKAPVVV